METTMLRKMMMVLCFLNISHVYGQTGTYKDVAVIINVNSAISDSIGTYFINERHIPLQNRIYISSPVTEEIDSIQFQSLRNQVESYLTANQISDSINYIVTTKGVPLKVKRSDMMAASSVESELTLILGSYSNYIQKSGRIVSPYYRQREHFTRARYGIYIVTRLDGYNFSDIKKIIDQSKIIVNEIPAEGRFVFDQDPTWNTMVPSLNRNMVTMATTLLAKGLNVTLDTTSTYLTGQQNVLGYTSWGSNDRNTSFHGIVNNTWIRGAIAETYVSTSGRAFTSPAVYGQSMIADLIAEGITAAKGYVYEPYSSAMADVSILFDLYTNGYTVSESYFSASPYLSWMDVVIGDPKFRLISSRLPSDFVDQNNQSEPNTLPVELLSFDSFVKNNIVTLQWKTAAEINNVGFEIERKTTNDNKNSAWNKIGFLEGNGTSNVSKDYCFNDKVTSNGKYEYRLKQIDQNGKIEYSNSIEVNIAIPTQAALHQNFPNPFNPSTAISFTLPTSGNTRLSIYDITGKEIAVLVHGELASGKHTFQFNADKLSSGSYFYTLLANNFSETKKMILIR
jgi:uncharacterized protein (TIGR03790 family)